LTKRYSLNPRVILGSEPQYYNTYAAFNYGTVRTELLSEDEYRILEHISAKIPTISPILIARFRAGFVFFDLDFNRATNQLGLSSLSSPLGGSPSQKACLSFLSGLLELSPTERHLGRFRLTTSLTSCLGPARRQRDLLISEHFQRFCGSRSDCDALVVPESPHCTDNPSPSTLVSSAHDAQARNRPASYTDTLILQLCHQSAGRRQTTSARACSSRFPVQVLSHVDSRRSSGVCLASLGCSQSERFDKKLQGQTHTQTSIAGYSRGGEDGAIRG